MTLTQQNISAWDPVEIADGACLHGQIGPFKLWIQRSEDEWQTAIERAPQDDSLVMMKTEAKPDGATWTRWAAADDSRTLALKPLTPDRAVVARPDSPLLFPPGSDLLFFISIPIWLRLLLGQDMDSALFTEPTVILSNSWFGTPTDGTLCYSLRTTARRNRRTIRKRPHMAVCPIHIKNQAPEAVEFQRLCIHAPHLNLYQDKDRLWTSQVDVTYQGNSKTSRTHYGDAPPPASPKARLISEAREPLPKGRIQKSIDDLKSFIRM